MDILNLIISLVSGLVGGNVAGAAVKEKSLGTVGNSIAGLIGGAGGNYLLQALDILSKTGLTEHGLGSILGNIGGSGVSGAVLVLIVGVIKALLTKKAS